MQKCLVGGSFYPPGVHHLKILMAIKEMRAYDKIILAPSGVREDKKIFGSMSPCHRSTMIDMLCALSGEGVEVDFYDIENDCFTPTHILEKRHCAGGHEVDNFIGGDWLVADERGRHPIRHGWANGEQLWGKSSFLVARRPGSEFNQSNCPPHSRILDVNVSGSSRNIREMLFNGADASQMVPEPILKYIKRWGLFTGHAERTVSTYEIDEPRILLAPDNGNPKAEEIAGKLAKLSSPNPNLIVPVGGDLNQLLKIKSLWPRRIPFFGVNAGRKGFLLNDVAAENFRAATIKATLYHLPLLSVEIQCEGAPPERLFAFNEFWVERSGGQAAWMSLKVNGYEIERIICDMLMVSTAAGSTGYATHLCGYCLPAHMRELILAGSAVQEPFGWKNAIFPPESVFEINVLEKHRRPVRGFIDGQPTGKIEKVVIGTSRVASAELAFVSAHDLSWKQTMLHLPYLKPAGSKA